MILSCIIIEDEPLAAEKLENFIQKTTSLELKESFDNAIDGIEYIRENTIDIIFLDIQMEHLTGIQFLETITQKPYVIITSAYSDYALKGYELDVSDYLLKPFGFDRFLKAVNKVTDDVKQKQLSILKEQTHVFVKSEYKYENICIDDILFIEGMKEYLRIVTHAKKVMTKQSFKSLMEQLPKNKFTQVHKSFVVQLNKIDSIERNRITIGNSIIPIGNTYKEKFRDLLKQQ